MRACECSSPPNLRAAEASPSAFVSQPAFLLRMGAIRMIASALPCDQPEDFGVSAQSNA
ncbi:MAG: hypothetical protein ACREPR_09505 [Brasilonema sp.]